jgi:hypothetical protein
MKDGYAIKIGRWLCSPKQTGDELAVQTFLEDLLLPKEQTTYIPEDFILPLNNFRHITQAELHEAVEQAKFDELGNALTVLRSNTHREGASKLCVRYAELKDG